MNISEEELIEYAKPILKEQGFAKKAKRWTKVTEHFTYCFFIQGSSFSKEDYYVRLGIIINDIDVPVPSYGHISIDVPVTTKEEVLKLSLDFFSQWDSIDSLKKLVIDFVEWEKRNPIEKRRTGIVESDPAYPCLFTLSDKAKAAILDL